ncbi:MAG TPA: hypothetical protein VJQ45_01995 [Ktedonobacterales bacterium]|nr:hypothetical protein [Ktedonobacterales bacterium]
MHAEKDAAYRDSWKRRGELISVMANIARKVDRLEYAARGASASQDETVLDTAVDLLVYSLKYQTYLADHHHEIAAFLFAGNDIAAYSDGPAGFELLLDSLDLRSLVSGEKPPTFAEASRAAVQSFAELERCFPDGQPPAPAGERLKQAITLTASAVQVVAAIRHQAPALVDTFIATWGGQDAG